MACGPVVHDHLGPGPCHSVYCLLLMCEPLYFYLSTLPSAPPCLTWVGLAHGLRPSPGEMEWWLSWPRATHTCHVPPTADLKSSGPCPTLTRGSVSCSQSGAEPHCSSLTYPASLLPHPSLSGSPCLHCGISHCHLAPASVSMRDSIAPPLVPSRCFSRPFSPLHSELLARVVYTCCSPHPSGPVVHWSQ